MDKLRHSALDSLQRPGLLQGHVPKRMPLRQRFQNKNEKPERRLLVFIFAEIFSGY
jgi:hypothetical protein